MGTISWISVIVAAVLLVIGFYFSEKGKYRENKQKEVLFQNFENRMNNRDFAKRIVVFDFLFAISNDITRPLMDSSIYKNFWTVGVWLDYRKRLAVFRLDRDTYTETDISFDKIQSVEVIEDGYSKTTGRIVGYGAIVVGSAKSKEFCQGLQIRIVTKNINTGTQAHFLKLYDPLPGKKFNKSDISYKQIQECARSIVDEMENIIRYGG